MTKTICLALIFLSLSLKAEAQNCSVEVERADNMWADAGVPSPNMGSHLFDLKQGEVRDFITDWKFEKQKSQGQKFYGAHTRRVTNKGEGALEIDLVSSAVSSQKLKIPKGGFLAVKGDLRQVRCLGAEIQLVGGRDCILKYERGGGAFAPFHQSSPDALREELHLGAGRQVKFETKWDFEKQRSFGGKFYGSHLRSAKNEGSHEIILSVFGPNAVQLGTTTTFVPYDYKIVLAPGEEKFILADLKNVQCAQRPYAVGFANSPFTVLLTKVGHDRETYYLGRPKVGDKQGQAKLIHHKSANAIKDSTFLMVDRNRSTLVSGDIVHFAEPNDGSEHHWLAAWNGGGRNVTFHSKVVAEWETWRIHKKPGGSPGDLIRHGDRVVIQSAKGCTRNQGCYLREDRQLVQADSATNNSPETEFQIWFKVQQIESGPFAGQAQWCFGGQGPGCLDTPFETGVWEKDIAASNQDPTHDVFYINKKTSLGSIVHDNCCLRSPIGKACGGFFFGAHDWRGRQLPNGTQTDIGEISNDSCTQEWQKAWDFGLLSLGQKLPELLGLVKDGGKILSQAPVDPKTRSAALAASTAAEVGSTAIQLLLPSVGLWTQRFGPYRVPKARLNCMGCYPDQFDLSKAGEALWGFSSDHLEPAQKGRSLVMPAILRPGGLFFTTETWPQYSYNPEANLAEVARYNTGPSGELGAPKGTKIDPNDRTYCLSGKAKKDADPRYWVCE